MTTPLKVLVTAVAGDLGQAIVKALRLGRLPLEIHGCDLESDSYGAAFVESYHVVPPARDEQYIASLDALCQRLGIQVVVPGSEPEILLLGADPLPCGVPVVGQRTEWLSVFGDKLQAMRALAGKVELAGFADGEDPSEVERLVEECGFPLVVKPRRSSGSRSVRVAGCRSELETALATTPQPVAQEFVEASAGEYSVGVFRCRDFETVVAFRRELRPNIGLSWQAEVVLVPEVERYAVRVAQAAGAEGSVNVQLRVSRAGPRLLEVNPRFSSLVAARAACGFHDAEWSLALAIGLPPVPPQKPFRPLRFRRFFHEAVDFGNGFGLLVQWLPRTVSIPEKGQREGSKRHHDHRW